MSLIFETPSTESEEEHWISVSDLMAGLMVVFLFIAISYIKDIVLEKERIKQIAVTWNETQTALLLDLKSEFKDDLPKWGAELNEDTLAIRFKEPSVLFDSAKSNLKPQFQEILTDFFPRYIKIVGQYRSDIAEIRIEGHTSSIWSGATSVLDAYFKNMELSQDRTRSVLRYALDTLATTQNRDWVQTIITANGLSSSKPVLMANGREDKTQSRRVEFRVRTNAERRIVDILQPPKP